MFGKKIKLSKSVTQHAVVKAFYSKGYSDGYLMMSKEYQEAREAYPRVSERSAAQFVEAYRKGQLQAAADFIEDQDLDSWVNRRSKQEVDNV